MRPAFLIPVIAGVAVLSAIILGSSDEAKAAELNATGKKNAEEAKKAVAAKDWEKAVANAIASADDKTVENVAAELRKAGKGAYADQMLKAVAEVKKVLSTAKAADVKTVAKANTPKPVMTKPAPTATKPTPKPATVPVKTAQPATPKASDPPKLVEAKKLATHLSATSRYKENQNAVRAYQVNNPVTGKPDGKYGPATARSFWNLYKILPPNPFYWPSTNTNSALAAYSKFLDEIAKAEPASKARIESMKKTLGR